MNSRRFLVITPCRDEQDHLPVMIGCMERQTVPPTRWIVVDDGSSDRTPELLAEAQQRIPWLRIVRREDRGERRVGPGVIEAFYAGLESDDLDAYDYVCKLDADLEIPDHYFERVIERMEAESALGNYSTKVWIRTPEGREVCERTGDENANGQAKFYRVACFKEIGGFVREVSWDGLDGHACRRARWIARSRDEEDCRMIHRRIMGSSHRGLWTGRRRWGYGKWYMGTSPWYVAAVSFYRMAERPFVFGGLGILWGYLSSMLRRLPRHGDADLRRWVRRFEDESLIRGKRRVLARYDARSLAHRNATAAGIKR